MFLMIFNFLIFLETTFRLEDLIQYLHVYPFSVKFRMSF